MLRRAQLGKAIGGGRKAILENLLTWTQYFNSLLLAACRPHLRFALRKRRDRTKAGPCGRIAPVQPWRTMSCRRPSERSESDNRSKPYLLCPAEPTRQR